jgi:sulfonate transport system ATP-binding protein
MTGTLASLESCRREASDDQRPESQAVRVRGLSRSFGANTILDGLDLEIAEGEFVALLGRSGSGKTTLLRTLAGLDRVTEGDVLIPERRAVVFQEARLLPWTSVAKNVAIGLKGPIVRDLAKKALEEVGLAHRLDAWPGTLSGGEAQRAALARALVREPELLLLDEPFAALDALTRIKMHGLVQRLWRTHGCAVLMVTHDVDEALLLADRILVLDRGRIVSTERPPPARPRSTDQPGFQALRKTLLQHLGGGALEEVLTG